MFLSLKLSDTRVYEPSIRARLGNHDTPILTSGVPTTLGRISTNTSCAHIQVFSTLSYIVLNTCCAHHRCSQAATTTPGRISTSLWSWSRTPMTGCKIPSHHFRILAPLYANTHSISLSLSHTHTHRRIYTPTHPPTHTHTHTHTNTRAQHLDNLPPDPAPFVPPSSTSPWSWSHTPAAR